MEKRVYNYVDRRKGVVLEIPEHLEFITLSYGEQLCGFNDDELNGIIESGEAGIGTTLADVKELAARIEKTNCVFTCGERVFEAPNGRYALCDRERPEDYDTVFDSDFCPVVYIYAVKRKHTEIIYAK